MSVALLAARGPITPDELEWARECAAAGDTVEDIAEGSDRSVSEWREALKAAGVRCIRPLEELTLAPRDALIAQRYIDGVTLRDIGREIGVSHERVRQLAERLIERGVIVRRVPCFPRISDEARAAIAEQHRRRGREGQAQYLPERNAAILELVAQGTLSYSQIGARFGIGRPAVCGVVHRQKRRAIVSRGDRVGMRG